jgi:hypothetical protein
MESAALSEQKRIGTLNVLEKKILLSFIEHTKVHVVGAVLADEMFGIAKEAGAHPALIEPALRILVRNNFLAHGFEDNSSEYWYTIHDDFYPEAVTYYPDESNENSVAPASDRFVSTQDSQPEIEAAIRALDEMSDRIVNSNELIATQDERASLSREVNLLTELLKEPQVRLAPIWSAIKGNGVVIYLATHGGDAVLKALATKALNLILRAFGWN